MHSSWWLTFLLVVPLVGRSGGVDAKARGRAYAVAIAASVLELALSLVVAFLYNDHVAKAQTFDFATRHVLSAPSASPTTWRSTASRC